jgi:hypothetical protein
VIPLRVILIFFSSGPELPVLLRVRRVDDSCASRSPPGRNSLARFRVRILPAAELPGQDKGIAMSTISFAMRVRVPPDVLVQELAGESVLLNLKNEHYFGLDDVGTSMWKSLTAAPNIAAAHQALLTEFDVDAEQLRDDLKRLVEQLVEHGLAEIRPD